MANLGYLQVTRMCNQACLFCSNPENENRLSLGDAMKAVDNFKLEGFEGVILTGGEPTLYEELEQLIEYCHRVDLAPRLISNGQKLADRRFFTTLANAGLAHVHLSIQSHNPEVQAYLTQNNHSLQNIVLSLQNAARLGVSVNVNTVINSYNADHLDKTVEWIVREFPFVNHFVWNNLDPHMNRVSENKHTIATFQDFEISLHNALNFLARSGRTFRVERVPLCYMAEYAFASTETRKIVKEEKRDIFFLDKRGRHRQEQFFYEKSNNCENCRLQSICAGVYCGDKYYSLEETYPIFLKKEDVVQSIVGPKKEKGQ